MPKHGPSYKENNRAFNFERWRECPRCGLAWPERTFRKELETGQAVCPECYDEPSAEHLKRNAQKNLADTGRQSAPWRPE